jgi:hypothetical protein
MDKRLLEVMSDLLIKVQHLRKDNNKRLEKPEVGMERLESSR